MKKCKCLVNKCLLGHTETMEHRNFNKQTLLNSSLYTRASLYCAILIYGNISLSGTANFFRKLVGMSKVFLESSVS